MKSVVIVIALLLCLCIQKGVVEKESEAVTGGIVVGVEPKVINASSPSFKIYLKNNENRDDVVEIKIEPVNKTIVRGIKAEEDVWIPVTIEVPANTTIKVIARSRNLNASSSAMLFVGGG